MKGGGGVKEGKEERTGEGGVKGEGHRCPTLTKLTCVALPTLRAVAAEAVDQIDADAAVLTGVRGALVHVCREKRSRGHG